MKSMIAGHSRAGNGDALIGLEGVDGSGCSPERGGQFEHATAPPATLDQVADVLSGHLDARAAAADAVAPGP